MTDPGAPIPEADDADVIEQETAVVGAADEGDDDYPHTSHDAVAEVDDEVIPPR